MTMKNIRFLTFPALNPSRPYNENTTIYWNFVNKYEIPIEKIKFRNNEILKMTKALAEKI